MRLGRGRLSLVVVLMFSGWYSQAAEVFVVRFDTTGSPVLVEPPCTYLSYRDDLIFVNEGPDEQLVQLLGVSNGIAEVPLPLPVESGTVRSSEGADSSATATWAPEPRPITGLWVARLNVPEQVKVVSRLLAIAGQGASCSGGFPDSSNRVYGGIPMPVVRSLVGPGVKQRHLGTDIGGNSVGSIDGRTNVGIFNAGEVAATATAEIRRACDGSLLESRTTVIPANSIVQLNGFSSVFDGCSALLAAPYEAFVVVTVDQPSFSYAITLSNERPPWIPVSSSH